MSEPDFSLGTVAGFFDPGFRTRRASTGVELGDGQSFAIAGLLQDEMTERVEKYPFLGDIPVLGALFRSSSYQKRRDRARDPRDAAAREAAARGPAAAPDRLLRRAERLRVLPARAALEGFDNRVAAPRRSPRGCRADRRRPAIACRGPVEEEAAVSAECSRSRSPPARCSRVGASTPASRPSGVRPSETTAAQVADPDGAGSTDGPAGLDPVTVEEVTERYYRDQATQPTRRPAPVTEETR